MKALMTATAVAFSAVLLTGCMNHPSDTSVDDQNMGMHQDDSSGTAGSARVPASVDPSRNELNHAGTSDQNGGSSAPSGATGTSGGR